MLQGYGGTYHVLGMNEQSYSKKNRPIVANGTNWDHDLGEKVKD